MTKRGRFPGRRAQRQAEAIARGWRFDKELSPGNFKHPPEARAAHINTTRLNTERNMGAGK